MSFVWRIWMRSAASAFAGAAVGADAVGNVGADGTQLAATTSAATKRTSRLADCLVSAVLQFVEPMVDAVLVEQLLVGPDLGDPALVKDDDPVDILDRR